MTIPFPDLCGPRQDRSHRTASGGVRTKKRWIFLDFWRKSAPDGHESTRQGRFLRVSQRTAPDDQPALYLVSSSIQLPTVKATELQYSGSSSTSLP